MRLKTLELQGFKSFPDKTVLSFDHPLTAVVGPNGSGKSNISDAIRWVLGEQSVKQLRGGRMEDVIFGGTRVRKRQGFAQVSLTLDHCAGMLPDGGDEVTVTRRYYRSGESEYALNGQQVRLRDVNALFMDTGLGQEGYALIGQGKIDEILSAKSTQRREIFEEAAGISRCRHQKEETERKLERTQENLLRIGDKIEELELQRGPLKVQAEKATKYLALQEELKVLEVSLWMDKLDGYRAAAAKAGISDISQRGDKLRFVIADFDTEAIVALCASPKYRRRLSVNAGEVPAITLVLTPKDQVLETALTLVEDLRLAAGGREGAADVVKSSDTQTDK